MFTFILDYKGQLQLQSETLTQNEKKERERRDGRNEQERKREGREGQEMGKVGKIEESRSKVCVNQQPSPHPQNSVLNHLNCPQSFLHL